VNAKATPNAYPPVPSVPPAPKPSSARARNVMLGNRSESEIERTLRSALHRSGLRFRKHAVPLPGLRCRADIVFPRQRIAVFVDGCFWHRCPVHESRPKANAGWWQMKLGSNVARDRRNNEALAAAGWEVLRFWTHEPVEAMSEAVALAVRSADAKDAAGT
jgi:DNA mismatch endonuclease, patch repair protein